MNRLGFTLRCNEVHMTFEQHFLAVAEGRFEHRQHAPRRAARLGVDLDPLDHAVGGRSCLIGVEVAETQSTSFRIESSVARLLTEPIDEPRAARPVAAALSVLFELIGVQIAQRVDHLALDQRERKHESPAGIT
ncbi:MAG TPA: hypothetical protein PLV92_25765, partial [Pirellulaceae bacterium]|nr:hypothetical protein [Pirellulaceae bacterium]